jgi:hypothetical protein
MVTMSVAAHRCCRAGLSVFALAVLSTAAGCGSNSSVPGASAVSSAASKASSAASSELAKVKGGADATADITAGPVTTGSDGKAVSELTVTNPTSDAHDYTVSVTFDDANGKLQDATVLTVSTVPANGSSKATAKSNRDLSGPLTAKVTIALRH